MNLVALLLSIFFPFLPLSEFIFMKGDKMARNIGISKIVFLVLMIVFIGIFIAGPMNDAQNLVQGVVKDLNSGSPEDLLKTSTSMTTMAPMTTAGMIGVALSGSALGVLAIMTIVKVAMMKA